jgi:hypothetical protein
LRGFPAGVFGCKLLKLQEFLRYSPSLAKTHCLGGGNGEQPAMAVDSDETEHRAVRAMINLRLFCQE